MKATRIDKILLILILSLLSASEIKAQELQRPEILHLWKKHRTVHFFHRHDSMKVCFNNGAQAWIHLDTIFEEGVFSKGNYISYQDMSAIYIERSSFFYQSIFKPLGGSLMGFGTYIGLNTIGLAINRGFHHPDTRAAGRYSFISFSSGLCLHLWADKMSFQEHNLNKRKITVY